MDFSIIKTVNNLLEKKGKKMSYAVLVEPEQGSISPAIKIYHVTLFKIIYGELMSKMIVEKFTIGGVYKDPETVKTVISERLLEYFLDNGI